MTGRLSSVDLPMFLEEGHRALGDELTRNITAKDAALQTPSTVAARLAALGLFDLLVPAADGGRPIVPGRPAAVDVRSLCLVREALAYHSPLADSVFAVQGLGSHPAVLTPAMPGRAAFLARVQRGESIGGFGLTEPEAGSDVASMRTTARLSGDQWTLDGTKTFISNVGIAHHYIVFARVTDGSGTANGATAGPKKTISAFFVPAGSPGLTLEPIATSGDHPLGRLVMSECRVAASALVGEVGHGLRLALGTLDVFRTSVGAAAVGMARRALDDTVTRVRERTQFGKRLADQQLTQAALADMETELDAARLLVFRAAWLKDQGERASKEVAMAKLFATEAAQRIIDRAVQLHGGLGVTTGAMVERLYREVRPLRIYEGTSEIQRLIIGTALVGDAG